jgi:formylmethanofuran dehydrogenase subunit E
VLSSKLGCQVKNFFGSAGALPSKVFVTRHSLLASVRIFPDGVFVARISIQCHNLEAVESLKGARIMDGRELEVAKAFHGHLGPFLVLGLRLGKFALSALRARKHFGIKVTVHCPPQPPPSCMVDGLQVSTGATYGKRNIELIPSDEIVVRFVNTDTNEHLTLRVPESAKEQMATWLKELGEEEASRRVLETENLFEVVEGAYS